MTMTGEHCMAREDQDLQNRLTLFLRRRYPSDGAKRLAAAIGCDPRSAKNYLNAHWPNARALAAIVRVFGRDVLEAVFAPEIEPALARLTEEERRLEEQIAAVRARRRQMQGGGEGAPGGVAADDAGLGAVPKRRAASDRRH